MEEIEEKERIAKPETDDELQAFLKNPRFISYVGMMIPPRPGVRLCVIKLEYVHFIPDTPRNDDYLFRVLKWGGMVWAMVSIPKEDAHLMEKVAAECGLRIANGTPHLLGPEIESFPASGDNVFTLENVPGHPIYRGSQKEKDGIMEKEQEEIDLIFKNWESRN